MIKTHFHFFISLMFLTGLFFFSIQWAGAREHVHDNHIHSDACSHATEEEIELSDDQISEHSISMAIAGTGMLKQSISLSGKITVNPDLVSHHVARVRGIAIKIMVQPGDYVRKGEVLAIIDSAELGQAKSEFYEVFNNTAISLIELQRARIIKQNTGRLLKTLQKWPELENLHKNNPGDMGEYRALLLSAYADLLNNRKSFQRRQSLFKDKIVSENDFLLSQSLYEKSQAEFYSKLDLAEFQTAQNLFEKENRHKINEFKLHTAEKNLLLMGLTNESIEELRTHGANIMRKCLATECEDNLKKGAHHYHPEKDDEFSRISVKASRSGIALNRQVEPGEEIEAGRIIFTIADLRSLWALMQVPARDIQLIRSDMPVVLQSVDGTRVTGRTEVLVPIVDENTRTATLRVTLANEGNRWFPGQYVTGRIEIGGTQKQNIVIPRNAVQNINGDNMVFTRGRKGFVAKDVKTGAEDRDMIEIISGLKPGQEYVATGAFLLKTIIVTSGMDPHAGHGH